MFRTIQKFASSKIYNIITNPNGKLIDTFMRVHGNNRYDLKKEDFEIWRKSFASDYNLEFFCKKGFENEIVFSYHVTKFRSISEKWKDFQQLGLAWIPENYRGKDILEIIADYFIRNQKIKEINTLACCVPLSQKFWGISTGILDKTSCNYYISYYDIKDIQIPRFKYNGINLKDLGPDEINDFIKYDRNIFPFDRSAFLLTHFKNGWSKIAYDTRGNIIGIGAVIRYPSGECVISPLYADNCEVAQMIFRAILEKMPLENNKLWRLQIRSNDKCRHSFEWIQPFVLKPIQREVLSSLCYSINPPEGIDFSKVFVNLQPTNFPA